MGEEAENLANKQVQILYQMASNWLICRSEVGRK